MIYLKYSSMYIYVDGNRFHQRNESCLRSHLRVQFQFEYFSIYSPTITGLGRVCLSSGDATQTICVLLRMVFVITVLFGRHLNHFGTCFFNC